MNFNFELLLFYAVIITGLIALIDIIFLAKKRPSEKKMPLIVDYSRSFFPVLLIVFILRSFAYEPFRIPSGSLEPTLLTGDFILVNKYEYGIRLPVIHKKIMEITQPKRGDIVVFRWPVDPSVHFIKRLIGLPGDRISYINKILYVNDQEMPQSFVKTTMVEDENGLPWQATQNSELFFNIKHDIYLDAEKISRDFKDIVVPEGMYFMMGDNRDDSADSRSWGFVPDGNIVGKAVSVWMSWNGTRHSVRWDRLGTRI